MNPKKEFTWLVGETEEDLTRIQEMQDTEDRHSDEIITGYETLTLGYGDREVWVTQPGRETHFWVCGSTGQGKSKFLEYLICRDIDRLHAEAHLPKEKWEACPLLFIDPTPNGGVVNKVLAYCDEIGFKNVILIDPFQMKIHRKVPPINLANFPDFYLSQGLGALIDAFRVSYEIEDSSRTAVITQYLKSLFSVIKYAGLSAHDLRWFTLPFYDKIEDTYEYAVMRRVVFARARANLKNYDFHIQEIGNAQITGLEIGYSNLKSFNDDMVTTARRLCQITEHDELSLIFGHRKGYKFTDVIGDRWVVLVNVSSLDPIPARLLATLILNQYIFAVERLRARTDEKGKGWNIPVYIYLDEASKYATDKLIDVLNTRRNSKIRMILSHQYPSQLEKRGILDSVKSSCLTKIAFYIADDSHRKAMIQTMYGGELDIREVSYALADLEKQRAVFKIDKKPSVLARVPTVRDAHGNVQAYIKALFDNGCYYSYEEIEKDYADRFKGFQAADSKSAQSSGKTDGKTDGKGTVPPGVRKRRQKGVPKNDEKPKDDGDGGYINL